MSSAWLIASPHRTAQRGKRLTGPRQSSWRYELLDLSGAPAGWLDGVTDASLEFNNSSPLRASGRMSFVGTPPSWLDVLVRPWYRATFPDGTSMEWPMGVFIPAAPDVSYGVAGPEQDVELQSLLLALDEDRVEQTYSLPVGTVSTTAARGIITAAARNVGDGQIAGTDSSEMLRTALAWDSGTSRLRIVNDLLAGANYFALNVDNGGAFRLDPYLPPSERGTAWAFVDDKASIYSPEFRHSRDVLDIPNKVVLTAQGDGMLPPLRSVVTNVDPQDPLSYPRRGRWITRTEDNVEATSQAVLDSLAARRMADLTQVSSTVELSHWMLPLDLNDVVTFRRTPAGLSMRTVVESMSVRCDAKAIVSTRLREVRS